MQLLILSRVHFPFTFSLSLSLNILLNTLFSEDIKQGINQSISAGFVFMILPKLCWFSSDLIVTFFYSKLFVVTAEVLQYNMQEANSCPSCLSVAAVKKFWLHWMCCVNNTHHAFDKSTITSLRYFHLRITGWEYWMSHFNNYNSLFKPSKFKNMKYFFLSFYCILFCVL